MLRTIAYLSVLFLLIGCALLVCAQQAAPDAGPSMVKFTSTLTNSAGKPLSGIVGVSFSLYAEKVGGTPLWMETQNVRPDKQGLYSVMLGSATAQGLPAEIFAGGGARWLGVQVSGQTEQPRTLLFSLPYGLPASAPAIQSAAHEAPNAGLKVDPDTLPTVHGQGTANIIPVWTAKAKIANSLLSQNSSSVNVAGNLNATGNVGVGTATPATFLDVFSSSAGIHAPMAQFGSKAATDSNSILTYNGSGTTEMFQTGCANCFVPGAQPGDGGMRVNTSKSLFLGDSGNARLRLDSAGNASQPNPAGGMVKAMVIYSGFNDQILACFNSTLTGTAASKPPCGFVSDKTGIGDYIFDFGFQAHTRFFSVTQVAGTTVEFEACTGAFGFTCTHTLSANQVDVTAFRDNSFVDGEFYLIVY